MIQFSVSPYSGVHCFTKCQDEAREDECKGSAEHNLLNIKCEFLLYFSARSDHAIFMLLKHSYKSIEGIVYIESAIDKDHRTAS